VFVIFANSKRGFVSLICCSSISTFCIETSVVVNEIVSIEQKKSDNF
jgi:hypothetical protein